MDWSNMLKVNYVTAELKNPTRDLPWVIHTAAPIVMGSFVLTHEDLRVIASYVAANVGFFAVLPKEVVFTSETVALVYHYWLI